MGRVPLWRVSPRVAEATRIFVSGPVDAPPRRSLAHPFAVRVAPVTAFAVAGLVAVGLAQAADALTFSAMAHAGGLGLERNPLIALAAAQLGITALFVVKAALVVLVVSIAVIVSRYRSWLGAAILTAGMIAGLVGAFSNFLALG